MKTRSVLAIALAIALMVLAVGQAVAAGQSYWYDMTVPKFGGQNTTNNQTKQYNGQAKVCSNLVGGDYSVQITLEFVNNNNAAYGQWYRIWDGTVTSYNVSAVAGNVVHMRLATDWTTPVDVQANGWWSPDTGC